MPGTAAQRRRRRRRGRHLRGRPGRPGRSRTSQRGCAPDVAAAGGGEQRAARPVVSVVYAKSQTHVANMVRTPRQCRVWVSHRQNLTPAPDLFEEITLRCVPGCRLSLAPSNPAHRTQLGSCAGECVITQLKPRRARLHAARPSAARQTPSEALSPRTCASRPLWRRRVCVRTAGVEVSRASPSFVAMALPLPLLEAGRALLQDPTTGTSCSVLAPRARKGIPRRRNTTLVPCTADCGRCPGGCGHRMHRTSGPLSAEAWC